MYVTLWKQGKQKEISNIDPHGQTYKMIEWVAASVNSKSSSLAVHKSIKYWLSVRTTQGVPDINLVKLRNPFLCIAKPLQIKEFDREQCLKCPLHFGNSKFQGAREKSGARRLLKKHPYFKRHLLHYIRDMHIPNVAPSCLYNYPRPVLNCHSCDFSQNCCAITLTFHL